jgi:hypothetical protein
VGLAFRICHLASAALLLTLGLGAEEAVAATVIGSDLAGTPSGGCATNIFACTMTPLAAGSSGYGFTAPSAGLVTAIKLKHGAIPGDNTVGYRILTPTGTANQFTARIVPSPEGSNGAVHLSTSAGTETTTPVDGAAKPKGVPIAAGEQVAVFLADASTPVVDTGRSGVGELNDNHYNSTPKTYSAQSGEVQLQVVIEPDANGNGYGDESQEPTQPGGGDPGGGNPGGGDPGGGNPGGNPGGNTVDEPNLCPPRGGLQAASWKGTTLDKSRAYDSARIVFDPSGKRHVAGVTTINGGQLNYFGPSATKTVDSLGTVPGDYALAIAGGQPVLGYARHIVEQDPHPADEIGVDHRCEVFFLARGPDLKPVPTYATARDEDAFHTLDMAADPKSGGLHLAYIRGQAKQLVYREVGGGNPESLPLTGVRAIRVAAYGGTVAVAASTSTALTVFVKSGAGTFKARPIAKGQAAWDMAIGPDKKPRLAFQKSLRLNLFNGSKIVTTKLPADEVAIAVDSSKRMHVAFDLAPHFACAQSRFGPFVIRKCIKNGLYYLRTDPQGKSGSVSQVGDMALSSPLSIATQKSKVAIAYADRGNKSAVVVRTP